MEWKRQSRRDIEGYEGLYQISYLGRVKSLLRIVADRRGMPHYVNERILKQIDENKSNNINNLEWCTGKYNINYGTCLWFWKMAYKKWRCRNIPIP